MNQEHIRYIIENMAKKSPAQIASELKIREKNVKKIILLQRMKKSPASAGPSAESPGRAPLIPLKKAVILAAIAAIVILGCAVYANSLTGKFVFDDDILIKDNAFIKGWPAVLKVFSPDFNASSGAKSAFYRPLQLVSYALDYRMWKLNVVGYHMTNMLLHILAALCVYWLISVLFGDRILSFLTAILFVAHPIHTVVVSYISTRADSLCLLFSLIAFIFYIKSSKSDSVTLYIIMALSYSLALLSKENSLILPALLLLYHYTFKEKIRPREFLSISAIAAIYALMRMTTLKSLLANAASDSTLFQRIPGFFAALATYIRLLFLPFGLHVEYEMPMFSFSDPGVICGLVILAGLIFCAFRTMKSDRLIFFSLSWFLIALVPVSNLYPLNAYMSENWLYLPSIGFFLALAGFLSWLYRKDKYRISALILTAGLLAFYSCLTVTQNRVWADPVTFYKKTLEYAPGSSRIYNNLGLADYKMGRTEEAIAMYEKAIKLNPNLTTAYNNLGMAYYRAGRKEDAVAVLKKSMQLDPNYVEAYINLGLVYHRTGKKDEASAMYRAAIEINPNLPTAYYNLGLTCDTPEKREEAVAMYRKAIELDPDYAESYNSLADKYDEMGRKEEAVEMHRKAIGLNPNSAEGYNMLGIRFRRMGKTEEAIAMHNKAVQIDPDYADAYNNLGLIFTDLKKNDEAVAMFRKAIEAKPDYAEAYNNLANKYAETGRKEDAVAMYKKAIEANPGYANAYNNLGLTYHETGRKDDAIAMYRKAIEIDPDYSDAYNSLGVAYFEMGKPEDAAAAFKRALKANPDHARARRNLELVR